MNDNIFDSSLDDKARSLTLTPDGDQYHILPQGTTLTQQHSEYPAVFIDEKQMKTEKEQEWLKYEQHWPEEVQNASVNNGTSDPLYGDQLCAGERIEDMYHEIQPSSTEQSEIIQEEDVEHESNTSKTDKKSSLEKRRQFSMAHSPGNSAFHSLDSVSSELSSHSRHSVTSFLQARECDAEDILLSLGLGGDSRMSVPERFLYNSSSARGISFDMLRRDVDDDDDDDIFDTYSTSYSSSWSDRNQIFERIPNRFLTSSSSLGSNTDISESEENESQKATIHVPLIVEPEQNEENSFDLMRHLRLNRVQNTSKEHQHDRILLEPVTEELEVSSVGSGSVRTKMSNTQQDSLDSLGNTSVLTKISRKQESEDSFKERITMLDRTNSSQEDNCQVSQHLQPTDEEDEPKENLNNNDRLLSSTENPIKDTQTSAGDSESGISSACESINLNVPGVLKSPTLKALTSQIARDSFELEEIATSDENLDKIEDRTTVVKDNNERLRSLKRENSDESSGFEDDTQVKKRSTESLDVPVGTDMLSNFVVRNNQNDSQANSFKNNHESGILVPFESSTPKNDNAESRRSMFAKRNAWSSTKQKRVAFQDEVPLLKSKSRSFDDQNYSTNKLETRRYSLDIPLPITDTPPQYILTETSVTPADKEIKKEDQSQTITEKTAVSNIRKFLSSLMSIRSRFKKTVKEVEDVSMTRDVSTSSLLTTGIPSVISIQSSNSGHVTVVSDSPLDHGFEEAPDIEKESGDPEMEYFVTGERYQKVCLEELDSFEEDVKRYRATFLAMETTSTVQEHYYTKKLLTRFAWDIIAIRRLRSLIKQELATMQSCITNRRSYASELTNAPLPHGIVDQMKCLLSMQFSLQNYLLKFSENVPRFHWKTTSSPLGKKSAVNRSERTTEDMTNEIKRSLFQELNQMFKEQVDGLRQELKEKDAVINELLEKVEKIEKSTTNTSSV